MPQNDTETVQQGHIFVDNIDRVRNIKCGWVDVIYRKLRCGLLVILIAKNQFREEMLRINL